MELKLIPNGNYSQQELLCLAIKQINDLTIAVNELMKVNKLKFVRDEK
jgi:hypothetical protein